MTLEVLYVEECTCSPGKQGNLSRQTGLPGSIWGGKGGLVSSLGKRALSAWAKQHLLELAGFSMRTRRTLENSYLCANYFTKCAINSFCYMNAMTEFEIIQPEVYEYQPGDFYSIHVTEQISCTFCEIFSTKILVFFMPETCLIYAQIK